MPSSSGLAPVFIVGLPRSGTTLLSLLLSGHSQLTCGPETHFFSKLSPRKHAEAVADPDWPGKAVEQLGALRLAGEPIIKLFNVSRRELYEDLARRTPSVRAMLESLMETHAARLGASCWVEKTPNHLLHLDRIRSLFPEALIVRMVRDPRDCALSMRGLGWTSNSLFPNCALVEDWTARSAAFFEHDRRCCTVRYEDLVERPRDVMAGLCEGLGLPFEPAMLELDRTRSWLHSNRKFWDESRTRTDSSRKARWKKELDPAVQRAVSLACFGALQRLGYEASVKPRRTVAVYPFSRPFLEKEGEELWLDASRSFTRLVRQKDQSLRALITAPVVFEPMPSLGRGTGPYLKLLLVLVSRRLFGPTLYIAGRAGSSPVNGMMHLTALVLEGLGTQWSPSGPFTEEQSLLTGL